MNAVSISDEAHARSARPTVGSGIGDQEHRLAWLEFVAASDAGTGRVPRSCGSTGPPSPSSGPADARGRSLQDQAARPRMLLIGPRARPRPGVHRQARDQADRADSSAIENSDAIEQRSIARRKGFETPQSPAGTDPHPSPTTRKRGSATCRVTALPVRCCRRAGEKPRRLTVATASIDATRRASGDRSLADDLAEFVSRLTL